MSDISSIRGSEMEFNPTAGLEPLVQIEEAVKQDDLDLEEGVEKFFSREGKTSQQLKEDDVPASSGSFAIEASSQDAQSNDTKGIDAPDSILEGDKPVQRDEHDPEISIAPPTVSTSEKMGGPQIKANDTDTSTAQINSAKATPQIQQCRYKTGKTLGAGTRSIVKECVHIDTGRYYAAKVINKKLLIGREHLVRKDFRHPTLLFIISTWVRNEIAVLKRVSMGHANILTLVDYFETMNNLYLVTDLALGGELFDRICRKGSYYEADAADIIRATLSGVAYLHDHGIVHRDLKPENILFRTPEDNSDLLIADFTLSRIIDEAQSEVLTTTCGTPGYMAPEIFKKGGHGKPVDVWAIGVIAYFLLCGYTPFDRDSNLEEMQATLIADYSFTPVEYWRGVSQTARDFINRCLVINPAQRMTAHEALSHPFAAGQSAAHHSSPIPHKNFNARRSLIAGIHVVIAINRLRDGSREHEG
ncbi:Calcium/calmodulin-dependent protein kinase cmkB [Lachnellula suecica]|uniref:Calcium/calmodulin-dependent protein kinase cmkB n=1 Tax=Lachnellula suecica TaxID=602035 RepID=A0A8T9CEG1_9HELO|nr:Calcium/calmodulin-dependent protein kinase cmkB [Lachnellula suecica]